MIYRESNKKPKLYNYAFIFGLLKYAYYGNLNKFRQHVTAGITHSYLQGMYFCINEGCKKNFDFAKFILDNFELEDERYKMSITATYIRNGKYDERLYLKDYDYKLY